MAKTEFFEEYITYLEKKNKSKAMACKFRAKNHPDSLQDMEVIFENGKKYKASSTKYDWFYSVYLKKYCIRESCFSCYFAKQERYADISLCDSWGDGYGKSLILFNTEVGYEMLEEIKKRMYITETTIDSKNQPSLFRPTQKNQKYDGFWDIYNNQGFLAAQKYIGNNTIKGKTIFFFYNHYI